MPFPDRTDRPSAQPCGCFAEECPEPVNIGFRNPDGTSTPYYICNHGCPADHHGSRHYLTKNKGHARQRVRAVAEATGRSIELLHVYSPGSFHEDLLIVGNLAGLTSLRHAVENAIEDAKLRMVLEARMDVVVRTTREATTSDGEGFNIRVLLDNRPWYDKQPPGRLVWDYRLPYTEDFDFAKSEEGRDPMGEWYLCQTCGKTFNQHTFVEQNSEPGEPLPPGAHEWNPRLTGDPAPKEGN